MGLQHILDQGRASWLAATGEPYTYRSAVTGRTTVTRATVEREIESLDNDGLVVKHSVAFMPANVIDTVALGDTLTEQANGTKWEVQQKFEDNETFLSLYVEKL